MSVPNLAAALRSWRGGDPADIEAIEAAFTGPERDMFSAAMRRYIGAFDRRQNAAELFDIACAGNDAGTVDDATVRERGERFDAVAAESARTMDHASIAMAGLMTALDDRD